MLYFFYAATLAELPKTKVGNAHPTTELIGLTIAT